MILVGQMRSLVITLNGNALKNLIKSKNNFSKKSLIGPLRSKKIFFRFFRSSVVQNGRFRKNLEKKFFSSRKGHFRSFFRKIFLSMIIRGQLYVDPENSSPQVERGQTLLRSENKSNHDRSVNHNRSVELMLLARFLIGVSF